MPDALQKTAAVAIGPETGKVYPGTKGLAAWDENYSASLLGEAIAKAIGAGDRRLLSRTGTELGRIIEAALKRREDGGTVTSCDMAAHSLAFLAVSVADGLANKGEPRRMLIEDARAAASDFQKDMADCEKQVGKRTGSHTSVERALRAL